MEAPVCDTPTPDALSSRDFAWLLSRANGHFRKGGAENPTALGGGRMGPNAKQVTTQFASAYDNMLGAASNSESCPPQSGGLKSSLIEAQLERALPNSEGARALTSPLISQASLGAEMLAEEIRQMQEEMESGSGEMFGEANHGFEQYHEGLGFSDHFSPANQGFGVPNQDFGASNQGFGQGYGRSGQGFGPSSPGDKTSNQGFGRSNPGSGLFSDLGRGTSTASLLAELQALQASMETPPQSGFSQMGGLRSQMGESSASFSTVGNEMSTFSPDPPDYLEDLLMSPAPDPLLRTTSGCPSLDTTFGGPPVGTFSLEPLRQEKQHSVGVPSPLDFLSENFAPFGGPNAALSQPPPLPASPLFAEVDTRQSKRKKTPALLYGRSASLGQPSTNGLTRPPEKKLFPYATFSSLDHTRPAANVDLTPSPPAEEQQSHPPQKTSGDSDTPRDTSRLVSAAEIMKALSKLPSRAPPGANRDSTNSAHLPPARRPPRPTSVFLSSPVLQDVKAPELFVQMSDEVLDSVRNRTLRGGYVAELEELRVWCLENLSEVVVGSIQGVHYLACNALPAAQYKNARLMLSKVTLWLQQLQANVRRISPVDMYMTIHEAGRIFLDSDLSLLANIPSHEAREDFKNIYLVMEKMKKEAVESLRFPNSEVNHPKPETELKPRILNHSDSGSGSDGGSGRVNTEGFSLGGDPQGKNKRKGAPPDSEEGSKKRLGFTNQLGNKGSEQQRQWLKGLHHELARLNEDEQVVMFDANPGGLAPVRRFVSEAGLMAKYNLRLASWRLLAAASEKFDTLAKGVLPKLEKYLGFKKYILGTCIGLTMAFCSIAGRETEIGKWDPKAELLQSLLERTKKGMELAADLACIMTDLRTYEADLLKLRVNAVGVMMREGGRSQQEAILLLEQRAETTLTALVAEVTSPPTNNPVLWTCWQLIFDFSRAQIAFHVCDDLDAKVKAFFDLGEKERSDC